MGFLNDTGGMIMGWMTTGLFWIFIIGVILIVAVGALYIRKKRKLCYPCLIISDLGAGKMGIEKSKAGWFKSRTTLFGLWDYGKEQYLKTKDGRKVQGGSSVDFHEIEGKRGLIVKRKDDDNHILVPLTEINITNEEILAEIAPADFRDASVDILKQAERETRNRMADIIQWVMFGGVIIFALVSIILITQMVQRGQAEATKLILKAGECGVQHLATTAP